jgi:hypothetical protein
VLRDDGEHRSQCRGVVALDVVGDPITRETRTVRLSQAPQGERPMPDHNTQALLLAMLSRLDRIDARLGVIEQRTASLASRVEEVAR